MHKLKKETTNYCKLNENNKIYKKNIYKPNMDKPNMDNYETDKCFNENECLICYEKVEKNMSKVECKLSSNIVHYKCYKAFIKKNSNYPNKCCHCTTPSLKFTMKYWWNYCCW